MRLINDKHCKHIYVCPTVPKCDCNWEGDLFDILEHVLDTHSDFLLNSNSFTIDVVQDNDRSYIMATDSGLFLVQLEVNIRTMTINLRLRYLSYDNTSPSLLRYGVETYCDSISFTNEGALNNYNPVYNTKNGVEIDLATIEQIIDQKVKRVHIKVNLYTVFKKNLTCLSFQKLRCHEAIPSEDDLCANTNECPSCLESDNETEVVAEDCFCSEQEDGFDCVDNPVEAINSDFIAEYSLQCVNCKCNMIPPIHVCPNRHNVCYACRSSICKICDEPITNLRNIHLEEHSKTLKHRCRYEPQGCTELCSYNEIRKHELECIFCIYKCEVCTFEGKFPEIGTHFRIAHPSTKIYETMSGIHFRKGSNFIILNSLGVFYCTSSATDIYIKWEVIYCGPKERFFSCEVKVSGKKQNQPTKHYFLKRTDNVYTWTVSWDELKTANVKEKYATLYVVTY